MADISMCMNHACKDKNTCYRFTAPVNPWGQSYISIQGVLNRNSCKHYWHDTRNEEELLRAEQWQEEADAKYFRKNPNEKSI